MKQRVPPTSIFLIPKENLSIVANLTTVDLETALLQLDLTYDRQWMLYSQEVAICRTKDRVLAAISSGNHQIDE